MTLLRPATIALLFMTSCKKAEPTATAPPAGSAAVAVANDAASPSASDAAPALAFDDEPVDAAAPPPPTLDGGVVDYSTLATAEWPSALEIEMHAPTIEGFEGGVSYPIFRSRPPELGKAMNAPLASHIAALRAKPRVIQALDCKITTSSRIAVVGVCETMYYDGEGGAPAGPTPKTFAYWMQPNVPPIMLDQLAPDIDARAVIARASTAPQKCDMACSWSPDHWVLDAEGIHFVPTAHCLPNTDEAEGCFELAIPFDQLRPQHPWGKKLIAWMKERIDKGETVAKYVIQK